LITGDRVNAGNNVSSLSMALKAEKIRKNADGFSSAAAEETMLFVAEVWDWLADNVERLGKGPNASLLR